MGGAVKKKAVRKMIRKENLDFLCIQETKLDHIDHKLCSSLWYDCDVDWGFQPSNTWVMKSVLQLFELSFGLKINFSKCNLYGVNIQEDILYSHVEFLHCKLYSKSFSYLGIPVGVSHKRKSTWTSLIDKIQSRLSSWYSTNISFVGRVILINVVLSALLVFYLSFYKALISVVLKQSPWVRDLVFVPSSESANDNWFWGGMVRRIGDRSTTSFWHDHWLGSSTLFSRYKRLYNLSNLHNDNNCIFGNWVGDTWERQFFTWEQELCTAFFDDLKQVVLSKDKSDYWEWRHEKSKQYSVKSAYKLICLSVQHSSLISQHSSSLWKSKAPPKVITFVWRLFQDRIPTKDALISRGISLFNGGGNLCSFCNDHLESTHHLFSTCTFTYHIWQSMYKWLDISNALPLTPFNHYLSHLGMTKDKKEKNVWRIIWLATIWAIWLHRNDIIFNHVRPSSLHLLDSARGIRGIESITYYEWLSNPIACLNLNL
ncbi:hypothetical protein Lal_00049728 [Lupinus albus]|nr:hypothetical protein Lal_00049728 [Lupinus albus]